MLRWASANQVPVRGAGSGLSGGATALDGGDRAVHRKDARHHVDPVTTVVCQPGLYNAEVKGGRRRTRPVVSPGSVVVRDLQHRRQISPLTPAGCKQAHVTGDYVLGTAVVLANGTAVRLGAHGPLTSPSFP